MNITVIGTGYVGLVTGACLAEVGYQVVCVDNDADKITTLTAGKVPIHEPGLTPLVQQNLALGRLRFTTDLADGIRHGEVIFIAVGTPPNADGSADLSHATAVATAIGDHLAAATTGSDATPQIIATKSTVPVGTTKRIGEIIAQRLHHRQVSAQFSMVSNPEFLKQGAAVKDCLRPDRIIIGAADDPAGAHALDVMRRLYAPFNRNHERVISMDLASAELTKYAANIMLAARISTMNELANLAERLGADIESVRLGVGADPRIGYAFIYPGCGFGGSCFPKDLRALRRAGTEMGFDARLLAAIEAVNNEQKTVPVAKALHHFGGDLTGKRFALWGLAFKPDTDDMRDAPSRAIIESLWSHGAKVQAFDPAATPRARHLYGDRADLTLNANDPYAALTGADALIVATEWRVLRATEPAKIKAAMTGNVVIDGRNLFDPTQIRTAGLMYYGIGRGPA